jgi:hypothetical protein
MATNQWTVFAAAFLVVTTLFACKKKTTPRLERSVAAPAKAADSGRAIVALAQEKKEQELAKDPKFDASHVSDKELCVKGRQPPDAMTKQPAEKIMIAMRGALRTVRANEVYGAVIMEFPSIKTWLFKVQVSRETGLVYVAQPADTEGDESIRILQVPSGATYARGKLLFSSEPEVERKVGDRWFEVPLKLLKISPSDAQPDGPQGPFGMNVGHKAVIAAFVQEAMSWYPDQQADWLFKRSKRDKACLSAAGCPGAAVKSAQMSSIDKQHRFFAGCQSLQVNSGGVDLELSASSKPLPLQFEPRPGTRTGRFRWGHYNQPLPPQTPPEGAVPLASL